MCGLGSCNGSLSIIDDDDFWFGCFLGCFGVVIWIWKWCIPTRKANAVANIADMVASMASESRGVESVMVE